MAYKPSTPRLTLPVSSRGQITLPAPIRKRLGLKAGGVLTLEERSGELILKPAAVLEMEIYSTDQIERWTLADQLDEKEKKRLLNLAKKKS